jgi:subtilase family serine protease
VRRPAALCALILVLTALSPVATGHAAALTTLTPTSRLASSAVPGLSKATLLGHLPSSQKLQVTVAIDHPNTAGEIALQKAIYDPRSSSYHHFLSPTQYAQAFGVSAAELSRVTGWLTRAGLSVGYASPSRTQVLVQGTVAQVEKTFDVTLNNYASGGTTFRAPTAAALVPQGVVAVLGLQTLGGYKLTPRSTSNDLCFVDCIGGFEPKDLWRAYSLPSTTLGRGVQVGIIGEGSTVNTIAGLRKFEAHYGLPVVPTRSVYVANDGTSTDGDGEWQIDSQAITGMAPDIERLSFYMAQDLSSVSNAISAWVNDPLGPGIVNMSIGGCEAINMAFGETVVDQPLFRQAVLQGRTFFNSTGDQGGSCGYPSTPVSNGVLNTGVPNAQWPSTSDSVVAVGGTVLYTVEDGVGQSGDRDVEYTWTHSGGGTSTIMPAPSWQQQLPLIKAPCATNYAGQPVSGYTACRGTPDVSALSGDILTNGYTVYTQNGSTFPGAGTSLSAPLWAGMWARLAATSATPLGFAQPLLYGLANGGHLDAFYDISVGTNVQWQAQPRTPANPTGWDFTNGLGVMIGTAMLTDLATGSTSPVKAVNDTYSQLDTVETGSPGGSGGAVTCVGNGSYADPAGDGFLLVAAPPEQDLLAATISSTATDAVFTAKVSQLAGSGEAQAYEFDFTLGGKSYDVEAQRGVDGATGGELVDLGAGLFLRPANITVTFDDATNTVTAKLPLASFAALTGQPFSGSLVGVTIYGDATAGPGNLGTADVFVPLDALDASACPTTV